MPCEITIPRLDWSMETGVFGEWLKAEGEFVQAGDPLFTLESDKALQEIEAVDSGILRLLPDAPQPGETVPVGKPIALLIEQGAEHAAVLPPSAVGSPIAPSPAVPTDGTGPALPSATDARTEPAPAAPRSPAISPRAARLARRLGLDWTTLTGSGASGRIREADIRAAAAAAPGTPRPSAPPAAAASRAAAPIGPAPTSPLASSQSVRLRRVIAERMMHSIRETAPVTLTTRVDATNLVSLRVQFRSTQPELVPAYQEIIACLVAAALRSHPELLLQWHNGELVAPGAIHLGFAVQTESGLRVPVIRECDRLSLRDLSRTLQQRIARARAGLCNPDELSGSTFTITNLGAYGIDAFTPILNPPESAILGLGAIRREPVVLEDDRIVPRHQMTLSLTFDHRTVDGAPAAQFLQALRQKIENPGPALIG